MKNIRFFSLLCAMLLGAISNVWGQTESADAFFSSSFKKGTPVQITNNRDKGFSIKFGNAEDIVGMPIKSGAASYTTEDIWYLVGNTDGFKMYNHNCGKKYALKLNGTGNEAQAVMSKAEEATTLILTKQEDNSYTISPKENPGMSFNMFGGAGRDIKLYPS